MYAETHPVWHQLCSVHILPAEPDCGGSGGIPFCTPWGEPDEVPGSDTAEAGHLPLHTATGRSAVHVLILHQLKT